ncbi:MAG TPA: hypothetical protein VIO81_12020 [Methyloversatilis sp.]
MKRLARCLTLLLAANLPAYAVTKDVPPPPGPIVGKWTWTRAENNCTEVYDYRADGTLLVVSGEEESSSTYRLSARPDAGGFHELKGQPMRTNGRQDCSDSPPTGELSPYTVYVIFHTREPKMLVCQTPALDQCFGPLRRIDP